MSGRMRPRRRDRVAGKTFRNFTPRSHQAFLGNSPVSRLAAHLSLVNILNILSLLAFLNVVCHVFPVSEGQVVDAEIDKGLRALAAQNACTQLNTARTRRFKLLRDLKAVEKEIGRKWQVVELAI